MNKKKTALVVGGNGIIGRNLTRYLAHKEDWKVLVTSRSPLNFDTTAEYVQMDLTNPDAVLEKKEQVKEVTHVFYAAYIEKTNPFEQVEANMTLLRNLMNGIQKFASGLEHVTFIQGGKAYGAHLGIYKTPAKESDPRSIAPNFYYDQEDFLREASKDKSWSWTSVRPDIVIGFTIGNPMNLSNLIAVYASLCKELGIPMRFPGSPKAYNVLVNVTGVEILSPAMEWAATTESAKNEIFNITNGDVFRWSQAWETFGEFFDVEIAEPQTFSLQEYMSGHGEVWNRIVKKHQLREHSMDELVQWAFGDFIFNVEYDAILDVNKARRFGFQEMQTDSIEDMLKTFQELKNDRIIP